MLRSALTTVTVFVSMSAAAETIIQQAASGASLCSAIEQSNLEGHYLGCHIRLNEKQTAFTPDQVSALKCQTFCEAYEQHEKEPSGGDDTNPIRF